MMFQNTCISDSQSGKSQKPDFVSFLHRAVCGFGGLVLLYCLFHCYLAFTSALQEVHKYEHTGTFSFFLYYLGEHRFLEDVCTFFLMVAELLLYVVQYRRAEQHKSSGFSLWYFFVMFAIHTVVWLHADSLPLPDLPPFFDDAEAGLAYRTFARETILPSAGYFAVYMLHILKHKKKSDM